MKKFEYLQMRDEEINTNNLGISLDESVESALTDLGNRSWELVSALYEYDEDENGKEFDFKRFYFKKIKNKEKFLAKIIRYN